MQDFKPGLRCPLLCPGDEGYDEARTVWNAMIDKRSALIVRCTGVADAINSINFARTHDLLVSVRGGGHNVAGTAVCDGGLMIDLSRMRSVRVDPIRRTARAEGGAKWVDFDHETQAFRLATTGGTASDTGIAGLTLDGGIGWLGGKYGLVSANLLSVDIVTADGRFLTASATEHTDLFWAVRGGGGNFGVVTSFEYQLHPVGPLVLGGMVPYPFEKARDVLTFYREFSRDIPDELTTASGFLTSPEGQPVIAIATCYNGPLEAGEEVLRPLREFGPPWRITFRPCPTPKSRRCSTRRGALNAIITRRPPGCRRLATTPSTPGSPLCTRHIATVRRSLFSKERGNAPWSARSDRLWPPGCAISPGHYLRLARPWSSRETHPLGTRVGGGTRAVHERR